MKALILSQVLLNQTSNPFIILVYLFAFLCVHAFFVCVVTPSGVVNHWALLTSGSSESSSFLQLSICRAVNELCSQPSLCPKLLTLPSIYLSHTHASSKLYSSSQGLLNQHSAFQLCLVLHPCRSGIPIWKQAQTPNTDPGIGLLCYCGQCLWWGYGCRKCVSFLLAGVQEEY